MRLRRFKYEKNSPLKSCYVKLSSTWNEVKATIASAFGLNLTTTSIESSSIVVGDSELHEEKSIPTLESYLSTIVKVASAVPLLDCTSHQRR